MKNSAAISACVLCVGIAAAQPEPSGDDALQVQGERVRQIAQRAIDEGGIVGLSVGIAIDGELVYAHGFGFADLERTRGAHEGTVYDIASTGKQFTAAAILRLVEDGKLSLDDSIKQVVPQAPAHFPDATIEQLLRHTSGFAAGRLDELNPPAGLDKKRTGLEVLDDVELNEGSIKFGAGETWKYCNPGFLMLGVAVEAASGEAYPDYLTNRLLRPAGLDGIVVGDRAPASIMADSIHRSPEGIERVPLIHMSVYAGQGSVCSSVVDLLGWQHALNEGRIVTKASLKQMRSPTLVHGASATGEIPYGMALRLGTLGDRAKIGHTGTYDGGSAALAHYPGDGLSIAVLTNTYGKGVPHALSIEAQIAALMLGLTQETPEAQSLTPAQIEQIQGDYHDGGVYTARASTDGMLEVLYKDKIIERFAHAGGLRFVMIDKPTTRCWFILDGDRAGWWPLERYGFLMGVARREDESPAP